MKNIGRMILTAALVAGLYAVAAAQQPQMIEIPAGTFMMGGPGDGEDFDEAPAHAVTFTMPFRMSVTEVTNEQYEMFDPSHKALRGHYWGISTEDDEAVTMVSWEDAAAYCRWLSARTGKNYRLPTEAEWEYACRAGSDSHFWNGENLDSLCMRNQKTMRNLKKVPLKTGVTPANPFGLKEMHGSVEEWCLDWYGPYSGEMQTDPCGPSDGLCRVTRGGSHSTPARYLRSRNRMAALPLDRHSQIGFRVVESEALLNHYDPEADCIQRNMADVSQKTAVWKKVNPRKPVFMPPQVFVREPEHESMPHTPFYSHNHQPALTWCDNGDLLAIWFSCDDEKGREQVVLASRLRKGAGEWDEASMFFHIPDRNVTGSSLLNDGKGRLWHFNGVANSGDWQNLALTLRTSTDNGCTWSRPELIEPEHAKRHQVIAGPVITSDGTMIQTCDAGPGGGPEGTSVHISKDGGKTWTDPWNGEQMVKPEDGGSGPSIAGIHGAIVELADGRLMTVGRGVGIRGADGKLHLPQSFSSDGGKSWTYRAMPDFLPIWSGQRVAMRRLAEGPIMLVSFTGHPDKGKGESYGMEFLDSEGNAFTGYGMFVALSFDEGVTWPVRRLVTDGVERTLDGGAWTREFTMDASHAETKGYLASVQTPDGMIHLISSRLHYRFNLAWILSGRKMTDFQKRN